MSHGFLGGTFDPVHFGHLSLAREALEKFSLEKIFFVPTRIPPHKGTAGLTPYRHRLSMLRLALRGNELFQVADIEPADSPSYTVDMIERVSADYPEPFFIMGMDGLEEMHTWKDPLRITELSRVVVGTRPGHETSSVDPELLGRVQLFSFPGVWISSSEIRERIASGRSISYLVPGSVESYIRSRGLYGA